jgi:CubicO group peptidase (beta-lactamase class C family)
MSKALPAVLLGLLALAGAARAQSDSTPVEGPAERRLMELIAAVESGRSARIRSFIREAYAPEVWLRSNEDRVVQWYTTLYDRSRGFKIDSLRATPTEAAALLRTELTGLWEELSVRVEAEPPHRITDAASFRFQTEKPLINAAADDATRVHEIDRIASRLAEVDAFSGVVLLGKGDSVLYLRAFGDADKERAIPIRSDTRFGLASITKTFVTTAIATLVEQGKVSWEDPLGKFFPEFPPSEAREKVRIKHLLTHTSGLRDFLRYCERNPCPEAFHSMDDYMRMAALAQTDSLLYEPGTRSAYTNANFLLLAKIIEQVSGESYPEYIRKNVFQPAGMGDTGFPEPGRVPERLAVGYEKQYADEGIRFAREQIQPEEIGYPNPDGAAYSTAGDLFRFARALRSGKILRPETVEILFSPKPEAGNWGYGFDRLDEKRGLVGHGGTWRGQSNSLDLFTGSGYTAVILSNYSYARSPLREAIWTILP